MLNQNEYVTTKTEYACQESPAISQIRVYEQQPENSPFQLSESSTSPGDSFDGLQYSSEELNKAFNQQASIDPITNALTIQPLQAKESDPPQNTSIFLEEMLHHFPDLPSFIHHYDFPVFTDIWLEFQRHTMLAREPRYRASVQSWLQSASQQIHYVMVAIAKSNPANSDVESQPRRIFSAFRRLKDRIEIMHQVFQIVETGRVLHGQTPSEAIAPLIEAAMAIRRDVALLSSNKDVIPVIDANNVNFMHHESVTLNEISNRVMDTYNLMPHNNKSNAVNSPSSPPIGTSLQPVVDCTPSGYQVALSNQIHEASSTNEPIHHRVPFSHIQPSWIHYSSSLPVTPSSDSVIQQFFSLPATPTCAQGLNYSADSDAIVTPNNTVRDLSSSPHHDFSNSPLNTIREGSSEYEQDQEEEDMDIDVGDEDQENSRDQEDDEEYTISDNDDDWKEEAAQRRKRGKRTTNGVTKRRNPRNEQFTRRTATSYDAQTTHYLKSIFFDIYSSRDKLTKEQRRQVERQTGLKPRNITYWFSNHKRRFQNSLIVFKRTVEASNGAVKTYDDFLNWRRASGLSEEVLENEILNSSD